MRRRRRAVSKTERARAAQCLARNLGAWLRTRRARRVACYLASDGEMDPAPLIERLRESGKKMFLPALHGRELWFLPYDRETPLEPNRFAIPEPDVAVHKRCRARDLDLVLVPLVAFDAAGNRLGMGSGYYDHTFSYLQNRVVWTKPLLIGIAYEFQRIPSLPSQPWDVRLHGVATELRLYQFNRI